MATSSEPNSTPAVSYVQEGRVAVIALDDGKANALSPTVLELFANALIQAKAEADAVVITGRPGRFSAGFDLKIMMSGADAARGLVKQGANVMMDLYEHPQPVVAAVSGHAIAGGVLLAACCDHRIGIEGDFKLGLNEVSNSLPLPILAHELARDRLSHSEFIRATLFATMYSPIEAQRAGWLDDVVPPENLRERALQVAGLLGALPRHAFAASKKSIRARTIGFIRETLEANIKGFEIGT